MSRRQTYPEANTSYPKVQVVSKSLLPRNKKIPVIPRDISVGALRQSLRQGFQLPTVVPMAVAYRDNSIPTDFIDYDLITPRVQATHITGSGVHNKKKHLVKGSKEAKAHMAYLRSLRTK